ncbi:hypothetical protein BH10ACI1_BH10ACI1_25580 [soil metagenome]
MEILIVGGIIVALMVYASTRIKQVAADAFERETIDTDEFYIIKPEGFLHPLNVESEFAFYAYSKEFGKEDAEEMRQAEIFISVSDKNFGEVCDETKAGAENVLSEEVSDAEKKCLIETETTIGNILVLEFDKISESENSNKVWRLKISVLKDFEEDYRERIDEIIESFRVK